MAKQSRWLAMINLFGVQGGINGMLTYRSGVILDQKHETRFLLGGTKF
jgi:hypothetical protein